MYKSLCYIFPIIIQLISILPSASTTSTFQPGILCSSIANGTKIKDPSACNKYITCVDDNPIAATCSGSLFYDRNSGECVPANSTVCISSDPCASTKGENGFVPDPYNCTGYYYCQNGKATHGQCSAGMSFNPSTTNCIRNYNCILDILPDDYCNIVPDGVFIRTTDSCVNYQLCWKGSLINGSCPLGFYFNAFKGECDYPSNVECSVKEVTTLAPPIPENVKCSKPGTFISDGVSCNGYYYCRGLDDSSMDLVPGSCPGERFFDPTNGGACVLRTNISCTFNRCVTLGFRHIQLANVAADGCQGFSICQAGEVIGQSQCPQGKYFNELLQLCVETKVEFAACARSQAEIDSTTTVTKELQASTEADVFSSI